MTFLAVTCMRNEGPYCLEWIAHHRAAGFTDFLIFTHDCTDGLRQILDLVPGITHVPFAPVPGKSVQWRAMQLADKHTLMRSATWAMFFDCDEFLCLDAPMSNLTDLIASVPEGTDAIALPWRLFGSSGLVDWTPGGTLDRFTMAAPDPFFLPAGHFFKALFRVDKFQKLGVHRPKNKKATQPKWSLAGSAAAPDSFETDDKRINLFGLLTVPAKARLNHYSTRSVTEFMIKRARGLPNRQTKKIDLGYWAERNFNTVHDDAIQHMLPATRSALQTLLNIDGIQAAQDSSVAAHRTIFDQLMTARDTVMLFLHLSMLQGSAAPQMDLIKTHLARLQNVTG